MEITKGEIGLTLAVIALLSWNAWTWYNGDGNTTTIPGWQGGETTRPTTSRDCPGGTVQVLDPSTLKLFTNAKDNKASLGTIKVVEKIVEREDIKKEYPDWFDPKKTALLADETIPPHKGATYVVSTLDMTTGKGGIRWKELPRPLWGMENEARVSLGYVLLGTDAGKFMLAGQYTPFRMGNWYANGFAQAIGDRFNAGASIEYRW